jgi:hypothetical protein
MPCATIFMYLSTATSEDRNKLGGNNLNLAMQFFLKCNLFGRNSCLPLLTAMRECVQELPQYIFEELNSDKEFNIGFLIYTIMNLHVNDEKLLQASNQFLESMIQMISNSQELTLECFLYIPKSDISIETRTGLNYLLENLSNTPSLTEHDYFVLKKSQLHINDDIREALKRGNGFLEAFNKSRFFIFKANEQTQNLIAFIFSEAIQKISGYGEITGNKILKLIVNEHKDDENFKLFFEEIIKNFIPGIGETRLTQIYNAITANGLNRITNIRFENDTIIFQTQNQEFTLRRDGTIKQCNIYRFIFGIIIHRGPSSCETSTHETSLTAMSAANTANHDVEEPIQQSDQDLSALQ